MKKLVLSLLIVFIAFNMSAQEQGKIRVGADVGLALPTAGVGFHGDLDIRYNIMDNLNAGLKFGMGALVKEIDLSGSNNTATAGALTYTLATGDYYFHKSQSSFAPFLGGGLGLYSVLNVQITNNSNTSTSNLGISAERKFGGLLRGGFEAGHFRMALEYYLIPSSDLYDVDSSIIGTSKNGFLNLSVGFYLGGGKWNNN